MTQRTTQVAVAVALSMALYQPAARAVIGIGDISFDPTVYGELVTIYEQGVKLWETTKQQLDRLSAIQQTINEANRAYESVVNFDIKRLAADLQPRANNGTDNRFAAMRGELGRMENTLGSNTRYYQYQTQRIKNLESLELLQEASTKNVERSSSKLNQATADQITAQSTSTLAALAAAEEQRRKQEEMALARSRSEEISGVKKSADLYRAIGDTDRSFRSAR